MRVVAAIRRQAAITGSANRNFSGGLVSDIAIHIGIDHVLAGSVERGKRGAKVLPVLCEIDLVERIPNSVVQSPTQRQFSGLARR